MNCQKLKYAKEIAEKLAKELKKKSKKVFGNTIRQERRAYLCPICKSYHLTSMSLNKWELLEKNRREEKRIKEIKSDTQIHSILKNNGWL